MFASIALAAKKIKHCCGIPVGLSGGAGARY